MIETSRYNLNKLHYCSANETQSVHLNMTFKQYSTHHEMKAFMFQQGFQYGSNRRDGSQTCQGALFKARGEIPLH